ncbi:hypothetical protein C2869_18835 [Saccharobesus litoralis]|uniref:Glucosylceramidase n=1 Tax=Saccharobesus litoralis TaxID=2172099 RepID=A0A2S0VVT7_9ALTE|nr:glycoside hydrolase family 30 beta sandwich domain-containing protein [Saccharobesus litoralis]AWB68337.1 hypothetical protein C2869_18835 [Saccharobesus litoralis]
MFKISCLVFLLVLLSACGGGGGSDSGSGDNGGSGGGGAGGNNDGISLTLADNGSRLPSECQFSNNHIRAFSPVCDLQFDINASATIPTGATVTGQLSVNRGASWQNLATSNNRTFSLNLSALTGEVWVRGLLDNGGTQTTTANSIFQVQVNQLDLGQNLGDFAADRLLSIADNTTFNLTLPQCDDPNGDTVEVEVFRDSQVWFVQQPGAQITLQRADVKEGTRINARCRDVLASSVAQHEKQVDANGSLIISFAATQVDNHAPVVSFEPVTAIRFNGQIRDKQTLQACFNAFDSDGDSLNNSLFYQLDGAALTQLPLTVDCAEITLQDVGGQRLNLVARSSDGVTTTEQQLDLGMIYSDTIRQAQAQNSRCVVGSSAQSVNVRVDADNEFDPFVLQVIDVSDGRVLRELGQQRSATISFACDNIGQTQYVVRNLSRGLSSDSVVYSHSVTSQANQLPQVDISVPTGAVLGQPPAYRDNQLLSVCLHTSDADNDVVTGQLSYQFSQDSGQTPLNLTNNCATVDTDGRGGQTLILYATASDGFATINETRNLGVVHADTIQFPVAQSGSCQLGSVSVTYQVNVQADTEGDPHSLKVLNASDLSLIQNLGAVTTGSFSLPCNNLGTTEFIVANNSRGLQVNSLNYQHVVTQAVNQAPSLTLDISGETYNGRYRDQQNLQVCYTAIDPEQQAVTVNARYSFANDAPVALSLDDNYCGQISTLNRGNQGLALYAEVSDGEVSNSLSSDLGVIYLDTIQVAFTDEVSCFANGSAHTYMVDVTSDIEGDAIALSVFNASDNSLIADMGNQAPFSFSLPCTLVGNTDYYIVNRSRNLGSFSRTYRHAVMDQPNTPPSVVINIENAARYDGLVRDNQTISVCIEETDPDGDNLTTTASYQFSSQTSATNMVLSGGCADINTTGQGGNDLVLNVSVNDGTETVNQSPEFKIHRDTIQYAASASQFCRIGDASRRYAISVPPDLEGDDTSLSIINADTGSVISTFGNASAANFVRSCSSAQTLNFYLQVASRGLTSRSVTYQHIVSNENNTPPSVNLSLTNPERLNGDVRDNQIIEVCLAATDAEDATLATNVFYQFDNEVEQELTLANGCGNIDLTNQGDKTLLLNGFASDGTATSHDTESYRIHSDTINVAVSASGSCRAGDAARQYAVTVGADAEGDSYSVDVFNVTTGAILASLGQVTASNFTLPCDTASAINFAIRTTARGITAESLYYSHVVSDTLNSAPSASSELFNVERVGEQIRDNHTFGICLTGTDPDNDSLTLSANYRYNEDAFTALNLDSQNCSSINTTGQGGNNLMLQIFVNDGQIETTVFESLGEIHTDTIQTAQTVSSECTLGESALRYSVLVPTDTEGDSHNIRVLASDNSLIANLGTANQSEFTLDCTSLGISTFTLVNDSRGLQQTSTEYTHKVNASLTNTVSVWQTNADQSLLLSQTTSQALKVGSGNAPIQIDVSDANEYQAIHAFGATLTDSAASLIHGSANTDAIVSQLFNPNSGIGISGLRYPMAGMSEFVSRVANSYNDRPTGLTDPDLDFFSISADEDFMLPTLQGALLQNPEIDLIATNWSAPGWMKTASNQTLFGGELNPTFYDSYANYFLKFFQAYRGLNIEFDYLSMQNQPHQDTVPGITLNFPSMHWDTSDYVSFMDDHLEEALRRSGFNPGYLVWDGNWTDNNTQNTSDIGTLANSLLNNENYDRFVKGVAWQCYQADDGFADYSQAFALGMPADKLRFLTECSNRVDNRSFGQILAQDVGDMFIGSLRQSVHAIYYASLALDENNGPNQGGCSDCRSVVTIDNSGQMLFNAEYYALGHFSQFVKPGAVRIDSATESGQIETVAFKNSDNSIVLVAVNRSNAELSFDVNWSGQFYNYSLPAYSVATFKWASDNEPIANAQQVSQASELASRTYDLIQEMRIASTGMFRQHYNVTTLQNADISSGATGFGLVALAIAHRMEWSTTAATQGLLALNAINGQVDGFTPDRNSNGMFRARMTSDGSNAQNSDYSVVETAQLLAGAIILRNTIPTEGIREGVDTLLTSVDWTDAIVDADTGEVGLTQSAEGTVLTSQLPYGEQMLIVWLAKNQGERAALDLWDNHYLSGEVFSRYVSDGHFVPANESAVPVSATVHQHNFYLIQEAISSANYRTLMREHAAAEKDYWLNNFAEDSYVWGFGFGENSQATSDPFRDSLVDHPGNYAHAPTIAGFVITDITQLEDFLQWQDNNLALVNNQTTMESIPWRFSQLQPAIAMTKVEMHGVINQLMGLASHPGLLDISFFRNNTAYPPPETD